MPILPPAADRQSLAEFGEAVQRILSTVPTEAGLMDALVAVANRTEVPIWAPDDDTNPYVAPEPLPNLAVKVMIPVWFMVDGENVVTRVVVDDDRAFGADRCLPVAVVEGGPESGWNDEDEKALTMEQDERVRAVFARQDFDWPGWDLGF